jgi:hypothetical protein
LAAGSGKQKPGLNKNTGKRPAIKTGEFKTAKTAPIVKSPDAEALETSGALTEEPAPTGETTETGAAEVPSSATETAGAEELQEASKSPTGRLPKSPSGRGGAPLAKTTSGRKAVPGAAVATARIRSGDMIWLICRECLEEWTVDPERAKGLETIYCPICEHRAQAPNDDILHQIALYKGIEKKNFTIAAGAVVVALVCMLLWTLMTSNPTRADNPAIMVGLPAVAFLSLIATIAFTSKYENSRWETYF